jgi:lysophospholipase L1-like esterase
MRCSEHGKPLVLGAVLVASLTLISVVPTIASPVPFAENGQGTLLFVGDSLTIGTNYFGNLKTRIGQLRTWPAVTIDAKVGRLATEGAKIVQKKLTPTTTAIVIALGTNDMISRRDAAYPPVAIDAVMEQSQGLPVLWCNVEFSPTGRGDWRFRARRFNRALRDAQSRWPNLIIADWDKAFTPSGASRYIADGVHLTVSGYKTRATFSINQLKSFGSTIVNASTTSTTTTLATTTTVAPSTTTLVQTTTTVVGTTTTSP